MATAGSFLGIDLGAGSVKLVELRNEQGRPRLVTYGSYQVPLGEVPDNDWSNRKEHAVKIIKLLLEQTNAQSKFVISALPTFEVFSSLITVPGVAQKDLVNAIRLEAKKVVPRPLEEMVLDWKEVDSGTNASEEKAPDMEKNEESDDAEPGKITSSVKAPQKRILITAASKHLVDSYVSIFKEAGLRLVGLETEAIALSRSLIGKDPSVVMVVDMGAQSTNLSIIERGIAVVNRGVDFGGIQVTEKMAEKMQASHEFVEQWKRDMGIAKDGSKLSPALQGILDQILHEIQYLFQLYRSQFQTAAGTQNRIEKIVLAGGSAFVPGLANYIAEKLNVPVHLGDPWARIVYPEDLTPVLAEIGPSMAVSVGLAMREILPK
jgi:type IV pilus assembly protein PilM